MRIVSCCRGFRFREGEFPACIYFLTNSACGYQKNPIDEPIPFEKQNSNQGSFKYVLVICECLETLKHFSDLYRSVLVLVWMDRKNIFSDVHSKFFSTHWFIYWVIIFGKFFMFMTIKSISFLSQRKEEPSLRLATNLQFSVLMWHTLRLSWTDLKLNKVSSNLCRTF